MVCIDQTDSELKERGVYGIGGWLSVSTELRILWSPPYFSRLWCVFELAAYRTANPEGPRPCGSANHRDTEGVRAVGITVDCIILVVLIWHLQRRWRQQRSALADLAAFDMDGVSCSDAFDRAFVTSAIEGWYGGLDGFTRYVRGPVREELLERFESLHLPFSFYNAMVLPFLGLYIDYALAMQMAEGHSTKEEVASHFFSKGLPRYFCLLICVKLSFDLAHRYAHRRQTTWVDLKATVAITMIFTVMNLTTQTLAPICYDAGLGASLATASVHGLAALLCLKLLEKQGEESLEMPELLSLSSALTSAFHTAPALAVPSPGAAGATLGFRASALVGWLAKHAQEQELWSTPLLDHLQLYGRLISSAWTEGGPLLSQPLDNNRFVVLLAEIMCQVGELEPLQRQHWTELGARCLVAASDFWRTRYFGLHLRGLLTISRHAAKSTHQRLATALVSACAAEMELEGGGLLERVLQFQMLWAQEPKRLRSWSLAQDCRPTAACSLVAFFADRLGEGHRSLQKLFKPGLWTALQNADESSGILRPCIYSSCLGICGPQYEIALTLAETLTRELLPSEMLDDAHLALPLEQWALHVAEHPSILHPARRWFGSAVFFAVSTVGREATLPSLALQSLLILLKALTCVDVFREELTGREALLESFCELDSLTSSIHAQRLYFWMGLLSLAEASSGTETMAALHRSIDKFMDVARDSSPEDVSWVLGELAQQALGHQEEKKAMMFFQLLLLAIRREPIAVVQDFVAKPLALHPPFRELFAGHVCATFPEKTRPAVAGWLLQQFPDAAKAFTEHGPAIGEAHPVLRSAYSPPWPPTHRFPMWKFHDLALQLLKDQLVTAWEDFVMPQPLQEEWIFLAHEEDYYRRFCSDTLDPAALRRIGFAQRPDHRQLVARTCWEAAGTLTCAREALKVGMAGHCAGGTHHAHRAWGSGYTVLNDLAITAKEKAVSKILICDLDVHQGDGTAEILQDEPRAFTMSVHCKENFPFGFKGLSHLGHDRSDLDVALPKGLGDEEYLATIFEHLQGALEDVRPELVLYDAGVEA
eukprot:g6377.t1